MPIAVSLRHLALAQAVGSAIAGQTGCQSMNQLLLVNDVKDIGDRIAVMLERMGWEVHIANDEKCVFESCVAHRPSLIIADIEMAGGQGFESVATARRLFPNLFIIAVTRGSNKDIWPKVAETCGADRYIVGPVTSAQLSEAILSGIEEGLVHS